MTLSFFKNNKPDTRMVEYDQAVVRLGLEKAALESEIERKERDLKNLNTSCDLARAKFLHVFENLTEENRGKVKEKTKVLSDFDERIVENEKLVNWLASKQEKIQHAVSIEEEKLITLSGSISETQEIKRKLDDELLSLSEVKKIKKMEKDAASEELRQVNSALEKIKDEFQTIGKDKIEINSSVEKSQTELKELNEIISILQASNKEGLDVVASFEGERKRLQEKEEFLLRKERDLKIYEERVGKIQKEAGLDTKMVFK